MLPRSARHLPAGEPRLVDPTWGGLRVLAAVRGETVRLLVDGDDVGDRFPGIVAALAGAGLAAAMLDGEIVEPDPGRLGLTGVTARGAATGRSATFVVSDLPWLDGRLLVGEPLHRRRDRLSRLGLAGSSIVVLQPAAGAAAVLAVVVLHGLAGIIAKRADSPYLPGVRSRLWTLVRTADLALDDAPAEPADDPAEQEGDGVDGLATPSERPDLVLLRRLPLGEDG